MFFSVIIPTRNRPAHLVRCLAALLALDCPASMFEVLIVDDGSTPPVELPSAVDTVSVDIRIVRCNGRGPARARNAGLRHGRGEFVVFTDDDCIPDTGWLRAFETAFLQDRTVGLGGTILCAPESTLCGASSQMLITFLYDTANAFSGVPPFFCSNNIAFPRQALIDIGGFDEAFPLAAAEDRDLCARWLLTRKLEFVSNALVYHNQKLNFSSFFRQHFNYGKGAYHFWRQQKERSGIKNRVTPLRFYYCLLKFPFSRMSYPKALSISVLLAISQAATAIGYYYEKSRCD